MTSTRRSMSPSTSAVVAFFVVTQVLAACAEDTGSTAAPPPAVAAARERPDGTTIQPDGGRLPDGVYRVEFSEEHLADHGLDAGAVWFNRGVWTTTLADGHWTVEQVSSDLTDTLEGVYEVVGRDLFWRFSDTGEVLHLRWSTDQQGDLHFTQVTETGPHSDFQFALPWTRVE